MLSVARRQERALVMVEPPLDLRGGRVLEIDDSVDVADEVALVEQGAGPMHQAMELELGFRIDPLVIKAAEIARQSRHRQNTCRGRRPERSLVPFQSDNGTIKAVSEKLIGIKPQGSKVK